MAQKPRTARSILWQQSTRERYSAGELPNRMTKSKEMPRNTTCGMVIAPRRPARVGWRDLLSTDRSDYASLAG